MILLSAACFILHTVVLHKGYLFFQIDERCREIDKNIVAVLMAASVAFLVVQMIDWYVRSQAVCIPPRLLNSLWYGFDLLNSIFYLTLVDQFTINRVCRLRRPR